MVVFYLRNSRVPDDKVVPITISLQHDALKAYQGDTRSDQDPTASGTDFPNLLDPEGDQAWVMVVAPPRDELDKDTGLPIPPEIINVVSGTTVHLEIEAALGRIGSKIEWPNVLPDTSPPQLVSIQPPFDQTSDVSIFANNIIRLVDPLPAAGMDLSTLNLKVNGIPVVTSGISEPGEDVELEGNVFDLVITHRPKRSFS
ncbi:MAG: hypothetical protein GF334_03365 [Candidatus Altiarchaeales archaeon]|nr:hypothetical protein [Candidatus Altiarchaeales archaeon]